MKDQVKHMYDRITMPEETEQAVRRAMHRKATEEKKSGKSWLRRAAAVAAVAALILLIRSPLNTAESIFLQPARGERTAGIWLM